MKHTVFYFHFLGLWYWQLGVHLYLPGPNFQLHVPFGFFKFGWEDWSFKQETQVTLGYASGKWQANKYVGSIADCCEEAA